MNETGIYADDHVDRYKEDPLVAAEKLAAIWCANPTTMIDVWGCDWPCKARPSRSTPAASGAS